MTTKQTKRRETVRALGCYVAALEKAREARASERLVTGAAGGFGDVAPARREVRRWGNVVAFWVKEIGGETVKPGAGRVFVASEVPADWESVFDCLTRAAVLVGYESATFDSSFDMLDEYALRVNPSNGNILRALACGQDENGERIGMDGALRVMRAAGWERFEK